MNINQENGTLSVTGLRELNAANAPAFQATLARALSRESRAIEIDLSQIQSVDGVGLGALVAVYETAKQRRQREGFAIRLTNPTPTVQQMIELTRLHHLFQVSPRDGSPADANAPINLT